MTRQPPKFVWIVLVVLGCLDLARGFIHTVLLEYAAINIAGLDLSSAAAADLLRLLGTFGISNWITGALYLLIGFKARHLALPALAVIPLAYGLGVVTIRIASSEYAASEASWGEAPFMLAYIAVCVVTLGAGLIVSRRAARG